MPSSPPPKMESPLLPSGRPLKRQSLDCQTPVVVREAQESVRMDGNGVNITEQSVDLARNGYQMQYVFGAISSDIATLQAVIRG